MKLKRETYLEQIRPYYDYIVDTTDLNKEIKSRILDDEKYYIFLDEIQHIENFEKALASLRQHVMYLFL